MRGRPFEPGNRMGRGRPPGSRNKRTLFAEEFQKDGLSAVQQCKFLALQGDGRALHTWIDRLEAPCRPRNNRFRLPSIRTAADLAKALPAVLQAIASGRLNAQEGEAIARIIESHRRVIEAEEFDARLRALEQNTTGGANPAAACARQAESGTGPQTSRDGAGRDQSSSTEAAIEHQESERRFMTTLPTRLAADQDCH